MNSLIYFDLTKQGRVQQHSAGPLIINNDLSIIHKTFSGICGALPRLCVLQRYIQTHTHTLCSTSHLHAHMHTLLHRLSFFIGPSCSFFPANPTTDTQTKNSSPFCDNATSEKSTSSLTSVCTDGAVLPN